MPMFADALSDLYEGLRLAPLWLSLGWEQTIGRFRRTILGPFWLSANLLFVAFGLSIIFGGLTGATTKNVFASLVTGLLSWSMIGGPMAESAGVFIGAGAMMKSQKLPLSFYIYLLLFRSLINFTAQILALWLIFLLFRTGSFPAWPLIIGLPLVMANVFLLCLIIAIPSTRFRDVHQLVGFVMQIAFFITPVFWAPQQMGGRFRFLLDYNPLAHFVELIRQPLLGNIPAALHFGWAFSSLIFLSGVALAVLALYRKRIVFWL